MLELGAIDLLVTLTKKKDPALRLNGIWALMVRMTCDSATFRLSNLVLSPLSEQVFLQQLTQGPCGCFVDQDWLYIGSETPLQVFSISLCGIYL